MMELSSKFTRSILEYFNFYLGLIDLCEFLIP